MRYPILKSFFYGRVHYLILIIYFPNSGCMPVRHYPFDWMHLLICFTVICMVRKTTINMNVTFYIPTFTTVILPLQNSFQSPLGWADCIRPLHSSEQFIKLLVRTTAQFEVELVEDIYGTRHNSIVLGAIEISSNSLADFIICWEKIENKLRVSHRLNISKCELAILK